MADINNLIAKIKEIESELKKLKTDNEKFVSETDEIKKIESQSKLIKFKGHILCQKDEYIQKIYLKGLASIILQSEDFKIRMYQIMHISRIMSSLSNKSYELKDILNESHVMEHDDIDKIIKNINGELAKNFAVDLLIMTYVDGIPQEKIINYTTEFISIFNFNQTELHNIINILKCILTNDENIIQHISENQIHYSAYYDKSAENMSVHKFVNDNSEDGILDVSNLEKLLSKMKKSKELRDAGIEFSIDSEFTGWRVEVLSYERPASVVCMKYKDVKYKAIIDQKIDNVAKLIIIKDTRIAIFKMNNMYESIIKYIVHGKEYNIYTPNPDTEVRNEEIYHIMGVDKYHKKYDALKSSISKYVRIR